MSSRAGAGVREGRGTSRVANDATTKTGVTTTDDDAWYIRQRYTDLGLPVWFMPYVNIQRRGVACKAEAPFSAAPAT